MRHPILYTEACVAERLLILTLFPWAIQMWGFLLEAHIEEVSALWSLSAMYDLWYSKVITVDRRARLQEEGLPLNAVWQKDISLIRFE